MKNKILAESLDDYKEVNNIFEAVGPEDLESDLYQGTKKLGKTALIGAGVATGIAASKGMGTAKSRLFIPMMFKKYKKDIAKDIDKWHKRYDGEFIKITDEAIKRIVVAKPKGANDPTAIQQYNQAVNAVVKSYKNTYIDFLNALHGVIKRDIAVYTKRVIKNLSTKGFGSITERASTRLTNKWDNIIRDINKYAYTVLCDELDKVIAKIDNDLGPNSALAQILNERPTAFFNSDDYNKISSFLQDNIERIKTNNTSNLPEESIQQKNTSSIIIAKKRLSKINNMLNSGNTYSRKSLIDVIDKTIASMDKVDLNKLSENEIVAYDNIYNELVEIRNVVYKERVSIFATNAMFDMYNNIAQTSTAISKAYSKNDIQDFGDSFANEYVENSDAHKQAYKALKERSITDINLFDAMMKKYT